MATIRAIFGAIVWWTIFIMPAAMCLGSVGMFLHTLISLSVIPGLRKSLIEHDRKVARNRT